MILLNQQKKQYEQGAFLVVALLLSALFYSTEIVTRDDYFINSILSFYRDGCLAALPLYYPLAKLYTYDMRSINILFLFFNFCFSVFWFELFNKLQLQKIEFLHLFVLR